MPNILLFVIYLRWFFEIDKESSKRKCFELSFWVEDIFLVDTLGSLAGSSWAKEAQQRPEMTARMVVINDESDSDVAMEAADLPAERPEANPFICT